MMPAPPALPAPTAGPLRPKAVLLDVNQTLFPLEPLRQRFREVGLHGPQDLELWFSRVLRDGFATAAADSRAFAPFSAIAEHHLYSMLGQVDPAVKQYPDETSVQHVLAGIPEAEPFADVGPAITALHEAGIKVATLTNGSVSSSQSILERTGVASLISEVMDVSQANCWKPGGAAYLYAAHRLALKPPEVMLVAVHPWDCHGAMQAGLQAGFVNRDGVHYPPYFDRPAAEAADLLLLVNECILAMPTE